MCQICTLALRHQKLKQRDLQLLNPKPLSVLVMLNSPPAQIDKSPASKQQTSTQSP